MPADRNKRIEPNIIPDGARTPAQRDYDRILYTSELRRLAEVTQVVSPVEGHVFHNRLTHTMEVAQIGRRLAQKLIKDCEKAKRLDLIEAVGGLDPDVVEASALAHDLGHPPFGHLAEQELCAFLDAYRLQDTSADSKGRAKDGSTQPCMDGFEGNAQSFRIVTKLAVRGEGSETAGLNLTRATLNALLKYPWLRGKGPTESKWGAYDGEKKEFSFAREGYQFGAEQTKSAEAELMDWADDVAYSVHDVEDFYRAGFIPLDRLVKEASSQHTDELDRFIGEAYGGLKDDEGNPRYTFKELRDAFIEATKECKIREPYHGLREQREQVRTFTATSVNRFVSAIALADPTSTPNSKRVTIEADVQRQVSVLKRLIWVYVIDNPALATQQHGQRKVIRDLLCILAEAIDPGGPRQILPARYNEQLKRIEQEAPNVVTAEYEKIRVVVDLIAAMTEQQALRLHQRLTGVSIGSVLEPVGP